MASTLCTRLAGSYISRARAYCCENEKGRETSRPLVFSTMVAALWPEAGHHAAPRLDGAERIARKPVTRSEAPHIDAGAVIVHQSAKHHAIALELDDNVICGLGTGGLHNHKVALPVSIQNRLTCIMAPFCQSAGSLGFGFGLAQKLFRDLFAIIKIHLGLGNTSTNRWIAGTIMNFSQKAVLLHCVTVTRGIWVTGAKSVATIEIRGCCVAVLSLKGNHENTYRNQMT
jgi:hypothetical protein